MPRAQNKKRTISYLRSQWINPPDMSLEEALRVCLRSCPDVADTRLHVRDMTAELRHRRLGRRRTCLHIAAWTDREPASIVPHGACGAEADLDANMPEAAWDYLDGDGMVLVSDDHCLLMPSGLHPKSIERYLQLLLEHGRDVQGANIPENIERFDLVAVADGAIVRRIRRDGVKRLHLNVEQYMETIRDDEEEEVTILQRLGRSVLETLVTNDRDRRRIEEAANIRARLIITCDSRRPGVRPDDLIPLAANISREDEDKIVIETSTGHKIKNGQLALKKPADVAGFAKTVQHGAAWDELTRYFAELEEGGLIEE